MRISILCIIIILSTAQVFAFGGESTQFWKFTSGYWTGGAYKGSNGSFTHCYIEGLYTSGIRVTIGLTREHHLNIVLATEVRELSNSDIHEASLKINGNYFGQFPAIASGSSMLTIQIGNRPDVFKQLRLGRQLVISTEKQDFYFSLDGTNKALGKVKECVDLVSSNNEMISEQSDSKRASISRSNEVSDVQNDWFVTESKSPIDNSPRVTIIKISEDKKHTLVLRCNEDKTAAYLKIDDFSMIKSASVLIKYDNKKERQQYFTLSTDKRALFFPHAISSIKTMMKAKKIVIKYGISNGATETTTFRLDGLPDKIDPLRKACHW